MRKSCLNNYGAALLSLGKYQPAIEKFEQALALSVSQNYVNWLYLVLGSLYYRIKKEQLGNTYFQLAIEHSDDKDAARLQAAKDMLAAKSYNKAAVTILKDIVRTSPQYAEASKMLRLNVDLEELFDMIYAPSAEEVQDTETLHRAIYHKMLNEIVILKSILDGLVYDYQASATILKTASQRLEGILAGIHSRREAGQKQAQAVPDDFRARLEMIASTAQDVSDFVNNGFFKLKADLQLIQYDLAAANPLAQELAKLIARIEQAENGLNDLKSVQEGMTIRQNTFEVQQLFATWQAVPTFQQAALRLDLRNGGNEFSGDEQKIRSFINELVENAVKHNPDKADLQIEMASYDETNPLIKAQTVPADQRYLVLQVCDNGKGVPPAKKDWIFLPLTTTAPQGSGLGLFIIARTLRKMGGYITETGTTGADFRIYLPYLKH